MRRWACRARPPGRPRSCVQGDLNSRSALPLPRPACGCSDGFRSHVHFLHQAPMSRFRRGQSHLTPGRAPRTEASFSYTSRDCTWHGGGRQPGMARTAFGLAKNRRACGCSSYGACSYQQRNPAQQQGGAPTCDGDTSPGPFQPEMRH